MAEREVVVLSGVRTAIGDYGGALKDIPPSELAAQVIREAIKRAGVDAKLLEILVCPATHGPLEYDAAAGELISRKAGLAYPIRDGIPIMLVSEARPLRDVP